MTLSFKFRHTAQDMGFLIYNNAKCIIYRSADKSLDRPGKKQARKHVREARDFNNIEPRAVIKIFFLHDKAPKEI